MKIDIEPFTNQITFVPRITGRGFLRRRTSRPAGLADTFNARPQAGRQPERPPFASFRRPLPGTVLHSPTRNSGRFNA